MPQHHRYRRVAAVALLGALAAACGSTKTGAQSTTTAGSGGDATGTTSGKLTASAPGVTATTIKIGFSYPDLGPIANILHQDNGPYDKVIKAIVDGVNKRGGVNGRKLEVSIGKFNPVVEADQLSVCTKFTEDDKVFAVLGGLLTDHNLCIAQKHNTVLMSAYGSGYNKAVVGKATAPWATTNASDERSFTALVKALDAQGKLKGKKIVIEGQTATSKALVDVAKSAVEGAGYKVTDTAVQDVDPSDTSAFNAADKVIAQRFKDEGADVFFIAGGTIQGAVYDSIGWYPAVYLPQTSLITAGAVTSPMAKFPFVGSVGNPGNADAAFDSPSMKQCRQDYKDSTGLDIQTIKQETAAKKSSGNAAMTSSCSLLTAFVAAATAAGPNLTQDTWKKGLEGLGKFPMPSALNASFGPGKYDAADAFQLQQHDPKWKLGDATDEFIPVGDPVNL